MKKTNFFNRHLRETGENYFEHFLFAFTTSLWLAVASIVLLLHSIFPFTFPFTAGRHVKKINEVMQKRIAMFADKKDKI